MGEEETKNEYIIPRKQKRKKGKGREGKGRKEKGREGNSRYKTKVNQTFQGEQNKHHKHRS